MFRPIGDILKKRLGKILSEFVKVSKKQKKEVQKREKRI